MKQIPAGSKSTAIRLVSGRICGGNDNISHFYRCSGIGGGNENRLSASGRHCLPGGVGAVIFYKIRQHN